MDEVLGKKVEIDTELERSVIEYRPRVKYEPNKPFTVHLQTEEVIGEDPEELEEDGSFVPWGGFFAFFFFKKFFVQNNPLDFGCPRLCFFFLNLRANSLCFLNKLLELIKDFCGIRILTYQTIRHNCLWRPLLFQGSSLHKFWLRISTKSGSIILGFAMAPVT